MQGELIALEGGEGSGKDTMIERLKKKYAGRTDIVFTREPGGTEIGEQIRKILLSPDSKKMGVRTEMLLFLAARAQLVAEVVASAMAQGKKVVSNRFGLSTIAYQIYGRRRLGYLPFVREISKIVVGEYLPHYILLDVTPEVGLRRVEGRGDGKTRFDAESLAFHSRVREGYLSTISEVGGLVIDADQPLEVVWSNVEKELSGLLG
jgi:dTMP kinase